MLGWSMETWALLCFSWEEKAVRVTGKWEHTGTFSPCVEASPTAPHAPGWCAGYKNAGEGNCWWRGAKGREVSQPSFGKGWHSPPLHHHFQNISWEQRGAGNGNTVHFSFRTVTSWPSSTRHLRSIVFTTSHHGFLYFSPFRVFCLPCGSLPWVYPLLKIKTHHPLTNAFCWVGFFLLAWGIWAINSPDS